VPQVVDALSPLPVVAAGGITDGRGLAAALLFGAAGANIGTRFLACEEASLGDDWKQRLVEAPLDGTVTFDAAAALMPGDERGPGQPLDDAIASGQGVGAIASIESAADIILDLVRGAEVVLLGAAALVAEPAAV
jgi:NAD(P)H-dependent flavin oxidoreductase YrpB (nitropropane dioxygenase family)